MPSAASRTRSPVAPPDQDSNSSSRRRSSRLSAATATATATTPETPTSSTTRRKSVKKEPVTTPQPDNSLEQEIETGQKKLSEIFDRHDDRVRMLFHLENFVSLVNYDPQTAKQDHSNVFEEYRQQYDLWSKVTDSKRGGARRATRRQIKEQQDLLAEEEKEKEATPPAVSSPAPQQQQVKKSASKSKSKSSSKKKQPPVKVETEEEAEESDLEEVVNGEPRPLVPPMIKHPLHMATPKYGGLENYLNSFVSLDEDMSHEDRDKFVADQIEIRQRIADGKKRGLLRDDEPGSSYGTPAPGGPRLQKFKDPIKHKTHDDYLVTHAIHFAKLLNDERKSHISKAKKVSQLVEQYFRQLETAEERKEKLEAKRLTQLKKKSVQELMKRWKLAEKVVHQRRLSALQEQQREKGKLQLNQILEQSAQLLESRFGQEDSDQDSDDDDDDDDDETGLEESMKETNEGDSDDDSNLDSDEMSSDDDDEDSNDEQNLQDKDDENLTVEELKKKYAQLETMQLDEEEPATATSDVEINGAKESTTEPEVNGAKEGSAEPPQSNEVKEEEEEESDESIPMDSEDDISSDEGDEEEEEEREPSALSALVNGHAEEKEDGSARIEQIDNDDDEDDYKGDDSAVVRASQSADEEEGDGETVHPKKKIAVPFLLRGTLREYQHYGLEWLAGLYKTNTNGILADEMGLGKTIQTIALIAYLACEKHIWGPHLIVVPTSVMLNWEMEFKRFAPGLKVMTYYGNPQQRKDKRRGWNKEDKWHVCITSYQLVLHQPAFRRKKWRYMILDEAHNIKNFRSQRWQALLNFNSERRLLLTGTPLQNNLVELWSLLYFLMPSSTNTSGIMPDGFANLNDFQDWFAKPVDKLVEEGGQSNDDETRATVNKLHQVLRPYLLRRLKADVEKQLPAKHEHIVTCRLSKRQRFLYDDFMSRAQTRETLASGNFLSIINCLMQLRKVCNHPDLFEVRPIVTSMAVEKSVAGNYELQDLFFRKRLLEDYDRQHVNLDVLGLLRTNQEATMTTFHGDAVIRLHAQKPMWNELKELRTKAYKNPGPPDFVSMDKHSKYVEYRQLIRQGDHLQHVLYLNQFRCARRPIYGKNLISLLRNQIQPPPQPEWDQSDVLRSLKLSYNERDVQMREVVSKYGFVTPTVMCLDMTRLTLGDEIRNQVIGGQAEEIRQQPTFHEAQMKLSIAFPDKRLLQYDCGKLQRLAILLRDLIDQGHRALIFTQMTRVLDVLERFLNIHGYRYLRLDGATKIEERQHLTEQFNASPRIPIFILSTRSGGLGINLTGADTVIFYDSDWNPSMDKQCQDRCHRIGQTRDVHIYRFVSEYTIESNILRKATQKQILDNVVIQEGDFTTDYFNKLSVKDMLGDAIGNERSLQELAEGDRTGKKSFEKELANAEDDADVKAAKMAMKEANVDEGDFEDQQKREGSSTARATAEPETTDNMFFEEDSNDEKDTPSIDDYMIRFIEAGGLD
ncbi:hypothetical protein TRICI_003730 [Trichomonascus ciferrii]|uniref:Helicase SWR1 n=1 Tax=Trichomonascus ciferrii TaxID=44093 RepID=A0A642V2Y7_9ASCO|nr:hypothetical protein TRICI_003730 [Trichomonascus ciferrii]